MSYAPRIALAAGFAMLAVNAHASEADYLKRFDGAFAGNGQVQMAGSTHNISCRLSGDTTASSINIGGTCSASIMSRRIAASLRVGKNGVYTGTYTGAKVGTASVSGRRKGNTVVLNVRWPAPVNGDTSATMILTSTGRGLSLALMDEAFPGGAKVRTTSVNLSRTSQLASTAD